MISTLCLGITMIVYHKKYEYTDSLGLNYTSSNCTPPMYGGNGSAPAQYVASLPPPLLPMLCNGGYFDRVCLRSGTAMPGRARP